MNFKHRYFSQKSALFHGAWAVFLYLCVASPGYALEVALEWDAPTTNTDSSPLSDLAGYKLRYGTSSGQYTEELLTGTATSSIVKNLSAGTYYFAVFAFDTAQNSSSPSIELKVDLKDTIKDPPHDPNNPTKPPDRDLPNDSDGDGIPDSDDSCPEKENVGSDSNNNGIDDACDQQFGKQEDVLIDLVGNGLSDIIITYKKGKAIRFAHAQLTAGENPLIVSFDGSAPIAADFDGDRISDLATLSTTGTDLSWNIINSASLSHITRQFGSTADLVGVGYFDHDSKADMYSIAPDKTVTLWLSSSGNSKTFSLPVLKRNIRSIATADLNHDGKDELIIVGGITSKRKGEVGTLLIVDSEGAVSQKMRLRNPQLCSAMDFDNNGVDEAACFFGSAKTRRYTLAALIDGRFVKTPVTIPSFSEITPGKFRASNGQPYDGFIMKRGKKVRTLNAFDLQINDLPIDPASIRAAHLLGAAMATKSSGPNLKKKEFLLTR